MFEERNSSRLGLLTLSDAAIKEIVRKDFIGESYHVEGTVFARGKFANVRKATHKVTGIQYAAKYIKKRRRSVDQMPEIHHEIAVLLKCSSNGRIVRLHEVFETNSEMVLVLELAAGGELQHIFDRDEVLGEPEARRTMKQILEGLAFLHDHSIAHLDLKPQNLLLAVENVCDNIKLCDFGVSRVLEAGVEVRAIQGTIDYVSPEILNYEPITLAADIWSIGVLAYVILSGFTPFGADDKQTTFLNISQGILTFEQEHFADVSATAIDFITSTLIVDPRKRPSVHQLLQHPWITPKVHIMNVLSADPSPVVAVTPKSTPLCQRKATTTTTTNDTPKSQRKSYENGGGGGGGPVRSYNNCLCAQCGTTCRHSPHHTPVSKTPITVDRGILC